MLSIILFYVKLEIFVLDLQQKKVVLFWEGDKRNQ